MPELPEILCRSREMNQALPGKQISSIEVLQPKSLNMPVEDFSRALNAAFIDEVTYHGKWIKTRTSKGWILLNMGMGGEILLTTRQNLPSRYRLVIDFTDQTCLVINFWWFGYVHFAELNNLDAISMYAKLGPNALGLTLDDFSSLVQTQKRSARVKSFLLDQSKLAGIGNAYIHDILFLAQLHPMRLLQSLSNTEINRLHTSIHQGLNPSIEKGGAFYELNLYGEKGGFAKEDVLIGYRAGSPCPHCGTTIEKIRTGSTSSFICPNCQPIDETSP